jgi:non-ribosomal peptide synthetase component F
MAFLLHHWLDRAPAAVPDKPALVDSDGTVTNYRQLRTQAQLVASQLRSAFVSRGDRVAIVQKRSSRVVASIFGVLYADAIYVPVHSGSPIPRFEEIPGVSNPTAVICDKTTRRLVENTLHNSTQPPAIFFVGDDEDRSVLPANWELVDFRTEARERNVPSVSVDVDAACLIFTSGTTGQPKGVAVTHRGIIDYIDWAEAYFELSAEDRILGTAPFHFDMSTFDVHAVRIPMCWSSTNRDDSSTMVRPASYVYEAVALPSVTGTTPS